jgi:hypothetical protein
VRPQEDGSLGILLSWIHPDQDEPLVVTSARLVKSHMAYLTREPDGWRVDRIA